MEHGAARLLATTLIAAVGVVAVLALWDTSAPSASPEPALVETGAAPAAVPTPAAPAAPAPELPCLHNPGCGGGGALTLLAGLLLLLVLAAVPVHPRLRPPVRRGATRVPSSQDPPRWLLAASAWHPPRVAV